MKTVNSSNIKSLQLKEITSTHYVCVCESCIDWRFHCQLSQYTFTSCIKRFVLSFLRGICWQKMTKIAFVAHLLILVSLKWKMEALFLCLKRRILFFWFHLLSSIRFNSMGVCIVCDSIKFECKVNFVNKECIQNIQNERQRSVIIIRIRRSHSCNCIRFRICVSISIKRLKSRK